MKTSVYYFFRVYFHAVEMLSLRRCINVVEEVLDECLLILKKRQLARGLSCYRFMAQRQIIEFTGATKKLNFLLCHQERLQIIWKAIWNFFVAFASQSIMTIILHQITSLENKSNIKGMDKKMYRGSH